MIIFKKNYRIKGKSRISGIEDEHQEEGVEEFICEADSLQDLCHRELCLKLLYYHMTVMAKSSQSIKRISSKPANNKKKLAKKLV